MLRLAAIGFALAFAMPALAQEDLPACPDTIAVTDATRGAAPAGWQHFQRDMPHRLIDIRFYAGPPADGRFVEPVAGSGRGTVVSMRYGLPAVDGAVWMSCVYAATAHVLVRRIAGPFPPHVRVNHDRADGRTFITYE